MMRSTSPVFITIASLLLNGCGTKEDQPQRRATSTLQLGTLVLAEWGDSGTLLDSAPRVAASSGGEFIESTVPRFSMIAGERVVAEFIPSKWQDKSIPVAQRYSAPGVACNASDSLVRIWDELSEIAQTKDHHSGIPNALATVPACEQQPLLDCFLKRLRAKDWNHLSTRLSRGLALKSVINSLGECSGNSSPWQTVPYFEIADGKIYFSPDPLYSIRIFAGEQPSYTYANDNFDSVAKLLNINCLENCFTSPQSLRRMVSCNSCRKLVKGDLYTAFLQLNRSEVEESFVRIVFRYR